MRKTVSVKVENQAIERPYTRLLNEIGAREIKHKAIQKALGISKCSLSVKLHGKRNANFTLAQAIIIHEKFFPDIPIEELFKK